MQLLPDVVAQDVVEACICVHNVMRERYPALQNAALDNEDQNHNLIPGWGQQANTHNVEQVVGLNRDTRAGSRVALVAEWRDSGRHSHRSMHAIDRPKNAQGRQKHCPD